MTDENKEISKDVRELACSIFNCEHLAAAQKAAEEAFNNASDEDRRKALEDKNLKKENLKKLVRKAEKKHPCAGFSLIQLVEWHRTNDSQDAQKVHTSQDWHNPEPFNGDIETAEILVVSMNPAYNFKDRDDDNLDEELKYPQPARGEINPESPEAHAMAGYFTDRFFNPTYISGGAKGKKRSPSPFPRYIYKTINFVFGDEPEEKPSPEEIAEYLTRRHVASTELFHCKSSTFTNCRTKQEEALDQCGAHLQEILNQAKNLKLVILLGVSSIRLVFDIEGTITSEDEVRKGNGEIGVFLREKGFTVGKNIALLPGHGQAQAGVKGILQQRTSGKPGFRVYLSGFGRLFQ